MTWFGPQATSSVWWASIAWTSLGCVHKGMSKSASHVTNHWGTSYLRMYSQVHGLYCIKAWMHRHCGASLPKCKHKSDFVKQGIRLLDTKCTNAHNLDGTCYYTGWVWKAWWAPEDRNIWASKHGESCTGVSPNVHGPGTCKCWGPFFRQKL